MDPQSSALLGATRLTRVLRALQDVRDRPSRLRFLARTPIVPATSQELMVRVLQLAIIADLIADGQAARTVKSTRFSTQTNNLTNLKIGTDMNQGDIDRLHNMQQSIARGFLMDGADPEGLLTSFYEKNGRNLLLGVDQRTEALIVAMALEEFNYSGYGVQLTGVKWGKPADLKVTVGTFWDNVNATVVDDILQLKLVAQTRYDREYNRLEMSTQTFRYMIANAQFINRVRAQYSLNSTIDATSLGLQNVQFWKERAMAILGFDELVLNDSRYWMQGEDGTTSASRFVPLPRVVLSSTMDDMDASVYDVGNAVPTESIVASLVGENANVIGELPQGQYGPIAYATVPPELNAPTLNQWAVAKRWPRLYDQTAYASLITGTYTDTIATGVAFPNFLSPGYYS